MSVLDRAKEAISREPDSRAVPRDVQDRLRRGRKVMMEDAHKRRLCQLFLRGEAYFYIDNKGGLNFQEIAPGLRSGKPAHRIRNRYNFIRPMVDAKVSSSTTRVPGYEVNPTSTDPEDAEAASLAQKVVRQGYEKWYLRETRVKGATLAIGGGGTAFALPYFDPQVGPFRLVPGELEEEPPRLVGEGEIKVLLLNGNEVYWEPGTDFYHSRWYAVETARPISEVEAMEGYTGGKLTSDASISDVPTDRPTEDMVVTTMYFERPSPKDPQGRMLTMANDRIVANEGRYPLMHAGQAIDEPCLHRLSYRLDPENERDLGLTWELIDFQRTLQDIYNKCIEIKNRGLNLRLLAPRGAFQGLSPPSDEPGGITYYNPVGNLEPKFENAPDPAILGQLLNIFDRVLNDMRYVAADTDVDVAPNVAANAVQQVIQQAANRWSSFLGDLARWDSEVARHCLLLAQNHYTEERVLRVRGRFGWEPESSFRGADIMGQVDVTVNPATIETRSRQAMLQTLGWIQANFPGYIRPEVAIEIAMNGASIDSLIESFEFDKARANSIIQKIRDGSILDMPSREELVQGVDPETGEPTMLLQKIPGWMPRKFDNLDIQMWTFENWLKTDDASKLPQEFYDAAMMIYDGMKQLQAQQQAEQAAAQAAQAESLGEKNAAKPQEEKPMPSTPQPSVEE